MINQMDFQEYRDFISRANVLIAEIKEVIIYTNENIISLSLQLDWLDTMDREVYPLIDDMGNMAKVFKAKSISNSEYEIYAKNLSDKASELLYVTSQLTNAIGREKSTIEEYETFLENVKTILGEKVASVKGVAKTLVYVGIVVLFGALVLSQVTFVVGGE